MLTLFVISLVVVWALFAFIAFTKKNT